MVEIKASTENIFNQIILPENIIDYINFKANFHSFLDPKLTSTFIDIYNDLKTYTYILEHKNKLLQEIKKEGFSKTAGKNKLHLEYFFLYIFTSLNPRAPLNSESKKLFNMYYTKYSSQFSDIIKLFGETLNITSQGFNTKKPVTVNGLKYHSFKFLLTRSFSLDERENVLYIHINGKNTGNAVNHITLPISQIDRKPKVTTDMKFEYFKNLIQIFQKGTNPCHFILKTSINDMKSKIIAQTRKIEKLNNMQNLMIMFKTHLDLNINRHYDLSIENVKDEPFYFFDLENEKLGPVFFALAQLDKEYLKTKLNFDEDEFKTLYLYLKNGKYDDYYTCYEDVEYDFLPYAITDFISLDEKSSVYEETLSRSFKNAGVYFIRDEEIKQWSLSKKLFGMVTPDFYFPDGIYINGELCYWIELKRRPNSVNSNVRTQLERYIRVFGPGALLLEEGFNIEIKRDILGYSIQTLNGTYQEIILC